MLEKRAHPVSAETRLDYSDVARMHVQTRKQSNARRLPTPEWSLDNSLLQQVIVAFLERRAGIRKTDNSLSLVERLKRAQAAIAAQRKHKIAKLEDLCRKFVASKCPVHKRRLDVQVEILDTYCSTTAKDGGASLVAAVVYLYYRVGLDSVGVGTALNLKPPHCRQILYRLNRVWAEISGQRARPRGGRKSRLAA